MVFATQRGWFGQMTFVVTASQTAALRWTAKTMRRETLVRAADAIEDLMIETGRGATPSHRAIWWAARALWILLQGELRV